MKQDTLKDRKLTTANSSVCSLKWLVIQQGVEMSNMGYCRFENTFNDLEDCCDHINDEDLSDNEKKFRKRLVQLCQDLIDEYEE